MGPALLYPSGSGVLRDARIIKCIITKNSINVNITVIDVM